MISNEKTFNLASDNYAKFRPRYPKEFYDFLLQQVENKDKLWDCACGTGQVAIDLADRFNQVYATDINANQLKNAFKHPKIKYRLLPSEQTDFPNHFFDLICVAQALHWFDIKRFFKEADRVLKPGGVLAVFGYGFFYVDNKIDMIIQNTLHEKIAPFWSDKNQLIINEFRGIDFPFQKINSPLLNIVLYWTLQDMLSYIGTWSAVKKYNFKNSRSIQQEIFDLLKNEWKNNKQVRMNLFSFIQKKNF